jgi:hypothetical protein
MRRSRVFDIRILFSKRAWHAKGGLLLRALVETSLLSDASSQPPGNADECQLKTKVLSAFINADS